MTTPKIFRYALNSRLESSRLYKYNILNPITSSKIYKYNIANRARHFPGFDKYMIYKAVSVFKALQIFDYSQGSTNKALQIQHYESSISGQGRTDMR